MNNRSKPVGHWITGLAAAMVQSCDIQRKHENFEIFLSPSPVEKIFFFKKKFKKIFKVIFYTFWPILRWFEKILFFSIFGRNPRLWLTLKATPYLQWRCPLSYSFSACRWTNVPSYLVIALLVWLQWYSKVAYILQKRHFCDLGPFLGVAPMAKFLNLNF